MKRRLYESRYFVLDREVNRQGRRFYRISLWNTGPLEYNDVEKIRDAIDPLRNRSGKTAYTWKFNNLKEAEERYTMLLLRWA